MVISTHTARKLEVQSRIQDMVGSEDEGVVMEASAESVAGAKGGAKCKLDGLGRDDEVGCARGDIGDNVETARVRVSN